MTEVERQKLSGHRARQLTGDEINRLLKDSNTVSEYKRNKLEQEARKNWDLFYKRNTTKFFKDRHWTKREFEELCGKPNDGEKVVIFEVGCGVGNFIFPLIEEDTETHFYFHACDFSPRAVQFVKEHKLYDERHCHAFQCDVTTDSLDQEIQPDSVDIATLIFVLSAINPGKMSCALRNLHKVLKPGGVVLFRDYGLYDHAMLRFAPGHKISQQFYVRQDGTRTYYFTEEEVAELFCACGYELISNEYVTRQTVNKKEGLSAERIFVQSKFQKKLCVPQNFDSHKDELQSSDEIQNVRHHRECSNCDLQDTNLNSPAHVAEQYCTMDMSSLTFSEGLQNGHGETADLKLCTEPTKDESKQNDES